MARPWESPLHFEPTSNYLILCPRYPADFAPGGRVATRFDTIVALTLPIYLTPVVMVALVLQI